jgi:hypothetical protein
LYRTGHIGISSASFASAGLASSNISDCTSFYVNIAIVWLYW